METLLTLAFSSSTLGAPEDPKQRAQDNPGRKEKKATDNGQTPEVPTPDIAAIEAAVQQAVAQIESIYRLLPDFVPAKADGLKGMPAQTVSDEFLEACAFAAEKDATMQAKTGLDPARTVLVINRNKQLERLATVAEGLVRDVRYKMFRERWDIVQQALHVYNLAKGFTRNERADALLIHVKKMKSAMGRSGNRGKVKTAPAPTPDPPFPVPQE